MILVPLLVGSGRELLEQLVPVFEALDLGLAELLNDDSFEFPDVILLTSLQSLFFEPILFFSQIV